MTYTERISVEQGIEAYRATGMVPKRCSWGGSQGGCGLAAIGRQEGIENELSKYFYHRLGPEYTWGFIHGFDGASASLAKERYAQGFEDGTALREAILPWLEARTPLPAEGEAQAGESLAMAEEVKST